MPRVICILKKRNEIRSQGKSSHRSPLFTVMLKGKDGKKMQKKKEKKMILRDKTEPPKMRRDQSFTLTNVPVFSHHIPANESFDSANISQRISLESQS